VPFGDSRVPCSDRISNARLLASRGEIRAGNAQPTASKLIFALFQCEISVEKPPDFEFSRKGPVYGQRFSVRVLRTFSASNTTAAKKPNRFWQIFAFSCVESEESKENRAERTAG